LTDVPYPKALDAFPKLRQSILATFDECPMTWHFGHKYGQGWSRAASARGILWHRFMAKAFREMAAQGEEALEVDVALAILHETLRQADVPERDLVACPMHEIADLYWMTKKMAYEMRWSINSLVDVEKRLSTVVEYPNPIGGSVMRVVTGQLDALLADGAELEHAVVIDHKTGWWLPPASQISETGFFQQRMYALLVMDNYPSVQAVTLREFYPRYSESREATIYRDRLDDVRLEIAALVERFDISWEMQRWEAMPGKQCFSGNTRFLTDQGVRTLASARDKNVRVLDRYGAWATGTVRHFGRQPLVRVTFDGGETVDVTPDHRWWKMKRDRNQGWSQTDERVTTVELVRAPLTRMAKSPELDPQGVRHGIVYGDGHIYGRRNYSMVRLQPRKAELATWFGHTPVAIEHYPGQVQWHSPIKRRTDGCVDVLLQPPAFKDLPSSCSPSYARGFLAGLIATDGTVGSAGDVRIHCEGSVKAEEICELARLGGIVVASLRVESREWPNQMPSGIVTKGRTRELMGIRLKPATAPLIRSDQAARLRDKHQMRRMYRNVVTIQPLGVEDVYCVVVPGSESFTLANGLATSNCGYCLRPTACPIFPSARRDGAIQSAEEADTVTREIMVADAALKQRKDALRVWTNAHGPVRIRDQKANRVYGHRASKRTERPSKEQLDHALAEGRDPRELYRETVGTRFEPHIPKDPQDRPSPQDETLIGRLEESIRQAEEARHAH
jgi:hypothetical protein